MAIYLDDVSRTFGEYLLIPGLTTKQCIPTNVSLKTPLVKYKKGEKSAIELNIPFVSAIMQSVSDFGNCTCPERGIVIYLRFATYRITGRNGSQGKEIQGRIRYQ